MSASWIALWLATPASALTFDDTIEAWTITADGQDGSTSEDRATGVAFDAAGNIYVVGWFDGAKGHGTNGYFVEYERSGAVLWDMTQDVGEIGASRTSSDDKLYAVAVDPTTDELAVCGRKGQTLSTQANGRYLVEAYPAATVGGGAPVRSWGLEYTDGLATNSPEQDCFGVARANDTLFASGWGTFRSPESGRWLTFVLDDQAGQISKLLSGEFSSYAAVPDTARGSAFNFLQSDFVVVGEEGVTGLAGSSLNNTDWRVEYYDWDATAKALTLQWSDSLDYGGSQLLDGASAVTMDTLGSGDVAVAGYVNAGANNTDSQDFDWYVVLYDKDGDSAVDLQALPLWAYQYSSGEGMSDRATAVAIDQAGDVFVAGTMVDAASGFTVWRVVKLAAGDGSELEEWIGPTWTGDSVPYAMTIRDERLVVVGSVGNGDAGDFAVTLFDLDSDGDGTADAVDVCVTDPTKTDPLICGCNSPDNDNDADGTVSCLDECDADPNKTERGVCDCGIPDTDTDGDLALDCEEKCDTDPNKTLAGECGCGNPDSDTDGDGIVGCHDACSNTPAGSRVDEFGCPTEGGTTDTGDTTGGGGGGGGTGPGCGCDAGATPASAGALLLIGALALARGRRRL